MSPHWGVNKWIACLCESMCIHNIYIYAYIIGVPFLRGSCAVLMIPIYI